MGEMLREAGWDASVNPEKRDAAKAVRPGEKMVVLRPLHSKQPAPQEGHQASVVQVLVELQIETGWFGLMGEQEAQAAAQAAIAGGLVQVADLHMYHGAECRT